MKFSDAATPESRARLVGERLAQHRLQLNVSQSEAASRAGISRDAVQRAEKGRGTVDTLLRLLAAYGLADGLELLLPEPQIGPAQLLAGGPATTRKRARRPAPDSNGPQTVWGDEE